MKLSCFGLAVIGSAFFLAACGGNVVLDGDTSTGGGGGSSSSSTVTDWCEQMAKDLVAKYESCGLVVTTMPSGVECTAELTAQAQCIETCIPLIDCPCVKDPGSSPDCQSKIQPYSDCLNKCLN